MGGMYSCYLFTYWCITKPNNKGLIFASGSYFRLVLISGVEVSAFWLQHTHKSYSSSYTTAFELYAKTSITNIPPQTFIRIKVFSVHVEALHPFLTSQLSSDTGMECLLETQLCWCQLYITFSPDIMITNLPDQHKFKDTLLQCIWIYEPLNAPVFHNQSKGTMKER